MSESQVLMTGIAFGESPRWHDDRLWFADWGTREVIAVDRAGHGEVIIRMPSAPFSIDWLPDGRLLIMLGAEARLLRREPDGSLVTHADLSSVSVQPWNEIVVDGRGNVYVNTIGFDIPEGEFAPGSIALVTLDGSVRQVADGLSFPNGMAVTPDNTTLIVAESYGNRLTAFAIEADGSLSRRRVWADLDGGVPDGICLDAENAIWYGDVPNQRCLRVREGGEVLQTIDLDRGCFASMLGGVDKRTLFLLAAAWGDSTDIDATARTGQLLTVTAPAPGAGWP
ncbi:MAG: SMP-30/gluconolactonase/LRE family protein [Chloroflexia bacterium]|nr:SMP-30/gluconolactonase/LRE family protein [Chloroflexia bacterium]